MNDLNSLCLTCLSTVDDGASISGPMGAFLHDVLHFKCHLQGNNPKLICRKCYTTLIELKRFCGQLRDVELYFESITQNQQCIDEDDLIEEVEEVYTNEFEGSPVDESEQAKLDPILIETAPFIKFDKKVFGVSERVESEAPCSPSKSRKLDGEQRFVCLICTKLFTSIDDLHLHEKTHSATDKQSTMSVILRKCPQKIKRLGCSDCGYRYDLMKDLIAHQRKHSLDKRKPFRCYKCSRRFLTSDALRDHELVHVDFQMCQCNICQKRYLNQSSLDAHMRVSHNISTSLVNDE